MRRTLYAFIGLTTISVGSAYAGVALAADSDVNTPLQVNQVPANAPYGLVTTKAINNGQKSDLCEFGTRGIGLRCATDITVYAGVFTTLAVMGSVGVNAGSSCPNTGALYLDGVNGHVWRCNNTKVWTRASSW